MKSQLYGAQPSLCELAVEAIRGLKVSGLKSVSETQGLFYTEQKTAVFYSWWIIDHIVNLLFFPLCLWYEKIICKSTIYHLCIWYRTINVYFRGVYLFSYTVCIFDAQSCRCNVNSPV